MTALEDALVDFDAAARETDIPFVVVGAFARDVVLASLGAASTPRATLDADVAVRVEDWARYDALYERATSDGAFRRSSTPHRLDHRGGAPVDVLPFGELERPPGTIAWREDDVEMTVAGFEAVHRAAVEHVLPGGVAVAVADAASLVYLKARACVDRPERTRRDVPDVLALLIAQDDELTLDEIRELGRVVNLEELRPGEAGGLLLGLRIAERFEPRDAAVVAGLYADAADPLSSIVEDAVPRTAVGRETTLRRASDALAALYRGVRGAR